MKKNISDKGSAMLNLLNASVEDREKICKQNRKIIEESIENKDNTGIATLLNNYMGDVTKYEGPFYRMDRGEPSPIVPLIWRTSDVTYMPTVVGEYAGNAQDPNFERIFPLIDIYARNKTVFEFTWNRSLLDKTKPGVPGSGWDKKVKKWMSQTDFYGKAVETNVWAMQSAEQVKEILEQISLYIQGIKDTFVVLIFTMIRELKEPIIAVLDAKMNIGLRNKMMVEKYLGDWNCVLKEDPLATLERNKIDGCARVGSSPDTLLMSTTTSVVIRKKKQYKLYSITGDKDNGTGLLDFGTRPNEEITSIGTTPVLIVENYVTDKFEHEPLGNAASVGEYVLITNDSFGDDIGDYNINQMSPYVGDYMASNGRKVQLKIKDLYEAANPFDDNGKLEGIAGDFLSLRKNVDNKPKKDEKPETITYFGDMLNNRKYGCTTQLFLELSNTLRGKALKSIGMSVEDEIKLLSKVSKIINTFETEISNEGDLKENIKKMYETGEDENAKYDKIKPDFKDKPTIFYDYMSLKNWTNLKVEGDNYLDEKKIMKEYVEYLDGFATFLYFVFGKDNLLFEKGNDNVDFNAGDDDEKIRWINRTFFNTAVYYEYEENTYPLTKTQAKNIARDKTKKNGKEAKLYNLLTTKDAYYVKAENLEFVTDQLSGNFIEHAENIHYYTQINTSTGPILLTYLSAKFTNEVILSLIKNNIAPPFGILAMRMMMINTDNIYWVKAGVTIIREQGETNTLKESNIHGGIKWSFNTEMGTCSNNIDQLYKAFNIRIKTFVSGAGSKIFKLKDWTKTNNRHHTEESFLNTLHKNDESDTNTGVGGSFFAILIPPGITEGDDFSNRCFSYQGKNVFSSDPDIDTSMPGYERYMHYVNMDGNFEAWDPTSDDMNRLYYRAQSEVKKNGKVHKTRGDLFTEIDDGCLNSIINADNYITDKIIVQ